MITVADIPKLYSVLVTQAVFAMGCAKNSEPVPVMPGVTWKLISCTTPADRVPSQTIDLIEGL